MRPTIYRPIDGYPGYRVGSDGSAWTRWVQLGSPGRWKWEFGSEWRELKPCIDFKGYAKVSLRRGIYHGQFFVHRLVLEAFVGPCPEGMQTCHYDGDKLNNRLENLRWDTPAANTADQIRLGKTKLTEADIIAIRAASASKESYRNLAHKYGVSAITIKNTNLGKRWWYVAS